MSISKKEKQIVIVIVIVTVITIIITLIIIGSIAIINKNRNEKDIANTNSTSTKAETKNANTLKNTLENTLYNIITNNIVNEPKSEDEAETRIPVIREDIEINTEKISATLEAKRNITKQKYQGYDISGRIEIPKINLDYPVLSEASKGAIEIAVGIQYGEELNEIGNVVIAGHNFQNGLLFSNNNKLDIGDEIYITDTLDTKVKYIIYDKFITNPEDTNYMIRNTEGKMEISLTTCTNDEEKRLIILAKEE